MSKPPRRVEVSDGADPHIFRIKLTLSRPDHGWGEDDLATLIAKMDEMTGVCKAFLSGAVDGAEALNTITQKIFDPETVPDIAKYYEDDLITPKGEKPKPAPKQTKKPAEAKPKPPMPVRGPGGKFLKKSEQPPVQEAESLPEPIKEMA